MTKRLLRNCAIVASMNDASEEWQHVDILIDGTKIREIGPDIHAPGAVTTDLSHHAVLPGLINTHHHFYQTLTRAIPAAQDASLFEWLKTLYPIWAGLTPEMVRVSTKTAMAELMLSGCSTSSDHLYLFPNGSRLDDSIHAALEMGMRFHATRGAMSVGESEGGLPPDSLVEREVDIIEDCIRLVDRFHDPKPGAMTRIAIAPCSPFSVSTGLMRDAAILARDKHVGLHTHLAENDHDVAYSLERFGKTPAEYAEELGWLGQDVWHAHCVKLDPVGIDRFAATATGVAHCPCSNMRLASGIAPIKTMLEKGVQVGLGVDGSASNDSGHLLSEARQAMLLQRVSGDAAALSARQALRMATRGGADVLNRDDIGQIAPDKMADIAAFRLDGIAQAGGLHDPIAALIFGQPPKVDHLFINGEHRVCDGRITSLDLTHLITTHNSLAQTLCNRD